MQSSESLLYYSQIEPQNYKYKTNRE